jgi:hypothetical protein
VFTIVTLCDAASADPPSILTHPLTDIGMIREISKFRSGAGHDFSYDASFPFGATDATEPPSSMKHYLAPLESLSEALGDQETVPVYAPLDGEITRVTNESSGTYTNKRIEITPTAASEIKIVLFHVALDDRYPQILNDWPPELWPDSQADDEDYVTTSVQAGDRLGYADMRDKNDFDVAVLLTQPDGERVWISYFDLMPDGLFARYVARGVTRAALEISKAQREADPITSWGGRNDDDWVALGAPVPLGGALPVAVVLTATALAGLRRHNRR